MMAFDHRKFLNKPKFSQKFATDCYLCYVCPENCYLSPPPPPQYSSPPPPPQFSDDPIFSNNSSKNKIPTILIFMLCVLGLAFLVLSYLTLARYRRRSTPPPLEPSRTFLDESHGPALDHPIWYIRTDGLPQSAIDAIASFPYGGADDGLIDGGGGCAVCLSDFLDGEMVRLLPKCSHAFHLRCIDMWLGSHKNCPVCRAPVLAADAGNPRVGPVQSSPTSSTGPDRVGSGRSVRRPAQAEGDGSAWETVDDDDHPSKNARPMRRSLSMDLSNSSVCRVMKNSSMKRSFSFSGKRSVRKNTESIQLLEIDDLQNHGL